MYVHFIDVGCGNMTLIIFSDGSRFMYDCNLTEENSEAVLSYLEGIIGNKGIDVFINSHRDADHMRGIADLHATHLISKIWDSGVAGTTTDSPEYAAYMELRRELSVSELEPFSSGSYGGATLTCMNSKCDDYSDPNEQSLVIRIEYKGSSVMLAGDTNYRPWKEKIMPHYGNGVQSSILLASHHGSIDFFDDPSDEKTYYTGHIAKILPVMTLVSVGPNVNDLPDPNAMKLYEKYSTSSDKGNKVFTTEKNGTMKLTLKDEGSWSLKAAN
jgi:beta-lactamase superfamily II metal-dependent hydrolase